MALIDDILSGLRETTAASAAPPRPPLPVPPHADAIKWLMSRGVNVDAAKLHPEFATRLARVLQRAEAETGARADVSDLYRDPARQAQYYANYTRQPVQWQGQTYQPNGPGGLAAPPGQSRHQTGNAGDVRRGPVLDWLHRNQDYVQGQGLEFLKGRAFARDPVHIQMAGARPQGYEAFLGKGSAPPRPPASVPNVQQAAAPTERPQAAAYAPTNAVQPPQAPAQRAISNAVRDTSTVQRPAPTSTPQPAASSTPPMRQRSAPAPAAAVSTLAFRGGGLGQEIIRSMGPRGVGLTTYIDPATGHQFITGSAEGESYFRDVGPMSRSAPAPRAAPQAAPTDATAARRTPVQARPPASLPEPPMPPRPQRFALAPEVAGALAPEAPAPESKPPSLSFFDVAPIMAQRSAPSLDWATAAPQHRTDWITPGMPQQPTVPEAQPFIAPAMQQQPTPLWPFSPAPSPAPLSPLQWPQPDFNFAFPNW